MLVPLLRIPLARYVPLRTSSQLTGRVSLVSAVLTQSRTLATKAKVEPAKAKKASAKAKKEPAKAKKEPAKAKKEKKQPKVDARKRVNLPAPNQPANPYIRFTSHYYKTHEIKQPVPLVVGEIKDAYAKLTPEEKQQFLPTEAEVEDYRARRAEWVKKVDEAKYKAKLSGYQLYVSENFSKSTSFEESSGAMKDLASNWMSLTEDGRAEWRKRAADQYEKRNRS